MRYLPALLTVAVLLLGACGTPPEPANEPPTPSAAVFSDVAAEAGLTHIHAQPILDDKLENIMSWMASVGATVAAGDFDNDGRVDLFMTSSRKGEPNVLYRNEGVENGTPRFTEVSEGAGLAEANDARGASMDAVWGDFDNDGWRDLYLVRWGNDSLYRNNGPGEDGQITFTDVTDEVFRRADGSAGSPWRNGNAAIWLDYDLDGRLDLYVGNYFRDDLDLWNLDTTRIMHDDFEVARNAGHNQLFRQLEDGTFVDVAPELGVDDTGWTLAVGSADLDNDGRPDLYAANDFGPDQVFLNLGRRADGRTVFRNATELAIGFDTKKGMNVDFGDFDNDGWLDIYVTNITTAEYLQEGNMLWHNNGPAAGGGVTLTDVSLETGTYDGGWGWGAKFLDYQNDGQLDILAVNGFISAGEGSYWYDLASWTVIGEHADDAANWPAIGDRSFSGYERTRVWRNDGLDAFTEVSREIGLDSTRDGRGIAVVDIDDDGDQDVVIATQNAAPHLYRNATVEQGEAGHWLRVVLEADPATGVNADAIGARVTLEAGGVRHVRERDGGNGYSGQSDPRLHFGLGDAALVERLEVRWPDGGVQALDDVAANREVVIRQDPASYLPEASLTPEPPRAWVADVAPPPAVPEIAPQELEEKLAEAETALRSGPVDRGVAGTYRRLAATYGHHDRAVSFLEELVDSRPGDHDARLELAVAYVDKIPTCGGLATIVCKGSLAKKGLDQADMVVEARPEWWLGYYNRGMNHLHWPRALRHSADAAADLERCVELQTRRPGVEPWEARVWVALGDAYAKDGRYPEARDAWRRGIEEHPGEARLESRLAVEGDEALLAYVEDQRSLERVIDTDQSFWEEVEVASR